MTFRNLNANEIEVKVKQVKENGLICLLYKTARTDMDLLDETVGAENWENDYREIKGNLYAGIGIKQKDNSFIWKWDCGIESREDGEGNEKKGEASDAFKRAGFRWGIGRALYTSPFIWITSDKAKIEKSKNGVLKCYDRFSVSQIEYSDDGKRITSLTIRNDTLKKTVFIWEDREEAKPEEAKPEEAKQTNTYITVISQLLTDTNTDGVKMLEFTNKHFNTSAKAFADLNAEQLIFVMKKLEQKKAKAAKNNDAS
jgi:hypothetical protein